MGYDSKWMRETAKKLRIGLLTHESHILKHLAEACEYLACHDASKAANALFTVIESLNALRSYVDSVQNVSFKRLLDQYGLSQHESELESCSNKIFEIIEKMKTAINKWHTQLLKIPPNMDPKYYDTISSISQIDLPGLLSDYFFRCVTAMDDIVLSSKEKQQNVQDLLQRAKYLGLSEGWALSSLCVAVQEIAAKKKIRELGGQYVERKKDDEGNEMNVFRQLQKTYESVNRQAPEILISIASSWRSTRAKLLHEGSSVDKETAGSIMEQTFLFLAKMKEK